MAEAVGIAAAALQFIQLGTKLLIAASKLRSKLENATGKVNASERSAQQLVYLVRMLEADLQPTSSTTLANVLTTESKAEAEHILEDCSKEASSLLDLLHGFTVKPEDSFVKGKMRVLSYIKNEEEIEERFKRLDELSSRLILWYHHQTLSSQKKQLDVLSSMSIAINAIGSQMNSGLAAVTDVLQQQQDAMTLSPSTTTTCIQSPVAFHRLLHPSGHGNAYLPSCTCKWSHLMISTYSVGPLSLMSKQSGVHERSCPYYRKNQTKDSRITIGFSLSWPFSQRVQLSFASTYAKGAYSIFPTLRTANIVDIWASPAFNHLQSAKRRALNLLGQGSGMIMWFAVDTALICPLQEMLKILRLELQQDFRSGVSSAMDVSSDGTSMLHWLVDILGCVSVYQDYLAEVAVSLLQLLIDFGIDINAQRQVVGSGTPEMENTLLLLKEVMDLEFYGQRGDPSLQFMNLLYRTGIDVPVWETPHNISFLEANMFPKLPDLALEVGFPKLTFAVISRNEHELRALLRAGHNVDEIYIQPFTPLCYSIGWPEGCQILLEHDADPNAALLTAFKYLDVAVIKKLLKAECALFAKDSPLEKFLWATRACTGSEDKKSEILSLLINAMADFRLQFMQLARENTPREFLRRRGWYNPSVNTPLLDEGAVPIAKLLNNLKIQIPRNLDPGVKQSVYHNPYLTTQAAQLLYSRGFTDIDFRDRNGCTPFMLCLIRIGIYEQQIIRSIPLSWFLDHGISIIKCPIPGFNLLHLLADCFGAGFLSHTLPFRKFAQELGNLDTVVHRLSRFCDPCSRDSCQCLCSSEGCLPLTLLFKRLWPRWIYYQYLGDLGQRCTSWDVINKTLKDWMRWCDCDPADQTLLDGICRLEIFQRLGMAHTCCEVWTPIDEELGYNKLCASFVSESEREQLQEEDFSLKVQLDALLETYAFLFRQYLGSVESFWTVWWEVLEEYLPQRVWELEATSEYPYANYVELENPWDNDNLPHTQDLWTKTDEIKSCVIAAMIRKQSLTLAS